MRISLFMLIQYSITYVCVSGGGGVGSRVCVTAAQPLLCQVALNGWFFSHYNCVTLCAVPLADTTPWHVPEGCAPDHGQPPGSSRTSGSSSWLPASHQGSTSSGASQGDAAGLRAGTASARSRRPPRPSTHPPPVGGREGEGWSAATDAASSAALHRGAAVQEGGWREELDGLGLEADAWLAENWDPAWGPSPTQPQPAVSGHWNKGDWWQGADVVDVESVEGSEGEEREGEHWMDGPGPDDVEGEAWVDAGDNGVAAHAAWGVGDDDDDDVVHQGGQGDGDAAQQEGRAIDREAVQDLEQHPSRPQSGNLKVAGMHGGIERGRGQAVSRSRRSHSQQRYMAGEQVIEAWPHSATHTG